MDISLTIMINPPANSRYRAGDIIECSPLSSSPCRHPRFALIHITGVPDKAPRKALLRRVKRMFTGVIENRAQLNNPRLIRKRKWFINPKTIPNAVKIQLRDNKEYTTTWDNIKPFLLRKVVVDDNDETKDTTQAVKDGDV